MTELAEPVAMGTVSVAGDPECPFDHDGPPDRNKRNIMIGKGSKLASNLKKGKKADLYDKQKLSEVLNPRYVENHPFYSPGSLKAEQRIKKRVEAWPVLVAYEDGSTQRLPVRCAAHHLIPSQESLQYCKLLRWMVKKGTTESLKTEPAFADGEVWCDAGYDTNGATNGVFLPGSYAVGGGRGGLRLWDTSDVSDVDDEGENDDVDDARPLTGNAAPIDPDSPKWQYVSQAIKRGRCQFHDRHEDYSKFVVKKLNALALAYDKRLEDSKSACDKCEETKTKWKQKGNPTPRDIVSRLDSISRQLRTLVDGGIWALNVYTSKWMHSYMKARMSGHKWAKL